MYNLQALFHDQCPIATEEKRTGKIWQALLNIVIHIYSTHKSTNKHFYLHGSNFLILSEGSI
jgi:hypothetical protein